MRRFLTIAFIVAGCAPKEQAPPPPAVLSVADTTIKTPESVLYDAAGDMYFVSNINGGPGEKDNNGFIAHVMPGGMIHEAHWIQGGMEGVTLHAPKGMAIKGDSLFVADIDAVRIFNRTTGAPLGAWTVPGATFLNDVAIGPDGTVYVTDSGFKVGPNGFANSGTDAIWKFGAGGKAVAVAKDTLLGRPNGITITEENAIVVSFGSGEVFQVNLATGARTAMPKPPKGQLDGVERLADGSLLVSSWEGNAVYRLANGAYTTAVDSVVSPADIGYDRKRQLVLIPVFTGNKIQIQEVR